MNHSTFIRDLTKNNIYFEKGFFQVKGIYKSSNSKILIKDKYGFLKMTPQSLLRGAEPNIRSSLFKTEYFKNKLHFFSKNYRKRKYIVTGIYQGVYKNIEVKSKYGFHLVSVNYL